MPRNRNRAEAPKGTTEQQMEPPGHRVPEDFVRHMQDRPDDLRRFDMLAPPRDTGPRTVTATLRHGHQYLLRRREGTLWFVQNQPKLITEGEMAYLQRTATDDTKTVDKAAGVLRVVPRQKFQFEVDDRALVFTLTDALPELERIFRGR